jgi:hypothetical protein
MTKLIHPYSLQAFPTEKILRDFKPVRGCYVRGKIELPPGQAEQLWASLSNHDTDPLAWQKPTVEVDLRPLFDAIAERMGYDPALLAEGRGETGRADHAWSTYADESGFPLLVRWQAGQGELLLSIGIFGREELSVAMLADEAGLETMLKVHDVVTGIEATRGRTERVSVPTRCKSWKWPRDPPGPISVPASRSASRRTDSSTSSAVKTWNGSSAGCSCSSGRRRK